MKTSVLVLTLIAVLVMFSASALAWTHKYECDFIPVEQGWRMRSGHVDWMAIDTDPDDPTNALLLLGSPCYPDPWSETLPNVDFNRPQLRLESLPDIWVALADVGVTFEVRFKQHAGGFYVEAYEGTAKFWMFAAPTEYTEADPEVWLLDVGQYMDEEGIVRGPVTDFTQWTVVRGTEIQNSDGTFSDHLYVNGEEVLGYDDIDPELKPLREGANTFRWGHGGGSGPPEGEFAEIWVDYIYLDTGGVYPPGVPTSGEDVSVGEVTWGKIKSQF